MLGPETRDRRLHGMRLSEALDPYHHITFEGLLKCISTKCSFPLIFPHTITVKNKLPIKPDNGLSPFLKFVCIL